MTRAECAKQYNGHIIRYWHQEKGRHIEKQLTDALWQYHTSTSNDF